MTSPPPPDPSTAISTAQLLGDRLKETAEHLADVKAELQTAKAASEERDAELKRYGRHNRLAIIIDVLLTVVATVAVGFAVHASNTADQTQQASATSCASGNEVREALDEVFDRVFASFSHPASGTPAQKAKALRTIMALEAYYHGKFAPRACAAIYGVTPASTAPASGKAGNGSR